MDIYVQQSVNARVDFFGKYYAVPEEIKPEVDGFIFEITRLGEAATDTADFESRFVSSGLSAQFNSLLTRCTPMAYNMTTAEKQHAKETSKALFKEDRSRILKEAAAEAIDYTTVMAGEELIAKKREVMIEAGVFDEYTRASNIGEYITEGGNLFKNLFKKKK